VTAAYSLRASGPSGKRAYPALRGHHLICLFPGDSIPLVATAPGKLTTRVRRVCLRWSFGHFRKSTRSTKLRPRNSTKLLSTKLLSTKLRPDAPLGSIALHRAESVAGSFGLRARALALVERRHSLRHQRARCVLGSRFVAPPLDRYNLARVPRRRGNRIQAGRHSSTNTHRTTAGNCRVYSRS
jgi:hypothetical protein